MTARDRRFANALVRINAIMFGEFTLKSGLWSPIYVDLRKVRSFYQDLRDAAGILWDLAQPGAPIDLVADVPTAGTPFAGAMAALYPVGIITPREPKTHGTKATIEGVYQPGQRVALIDDLITDAGSKIQRLKTLTEEGLVVTNVCVLVDREQGGRKALADAGYDLQAAFTLRALLDYYMRQGCITRAQYVATIEYMEAPLSFKNNQEIKSRQDAERADAEKRLKFEELAAG